MPLYQLGTDEFDGVRLTTDQTERHYLRQDSSVRDLGIAAHVYPRSFNGTIPLLEFISGDGRNFSYAALPADISRLIESEWNQGNAVGYLLAAPKDTATFNQIKTIAGERQLSEGIWYVVQNRNMTGTVALRSQNSNGTIFGTVPRTGDILPSVQDNAFAAPYNKQLVTSQGVRINGSGSVTEWAMLRAWFIYENMIDEIIPPYKNSKLKNFQMLIISKDDSAAEMYRYPLTTVWDSAYIADNLSFAQFFCKLISYSLDRSICFHCS